jgi:two-component system invasion response regulator UvrY
MIKILVADDHPIVRRGLKQILSEDPSLVVAGEAADGPEVLDKARTNDYDLVLLDISMPGQDGLSVLKQLKSEKPELAVLVMSIHPENQYAVRVLKAGASGYVTKDSAPQELISAIRAALAGRKYVSSSLAQDLASQLGKTGEKLPHEALSDREFSILRQIASGKPKQAIARELFLSPKTVSTYRSRVLKKMGLKTDADIIRYAIENRLMGG